MIDHEGLNVDEWFMLFFIYFDILLGVIDSIEIHRGVMFNFLRWTLSELLWETIIISIHPIKKMLQNSFVRLRLLFGEN